MFPGENYSKTSRLPKTEKDLHFQEAEDLRFPAEICAKESDLKLQEA